MFSLTNYQYESLLEFSKKLCKVSFYFMVARILSVVIISALMGLNWVIKRDFWIIPVFALEVDFAQFTLMNTLSELATSAAMLVGLLWSVRPRFRKRPFQRVGILAWYCGMWMAVLMYAVSIAINGYNRFQIYTPWALIVLVVAIVSTFVLWRIRKKDLDANTLELTQSPTL